MTNKENQILLNLFEELTYIKNTNRSFNALRRSFWTDPNPPSTLNNNGFFGQLQGPFSANSNLMEKIQQQCNSSEPVIVTKIGIHNANYKDQELQFLPIIKINNIPFIIGKTNILELEDVNITSLQVLQNVNNLFFINYQYILQ